MSTDIAAPNEGSATTAREIADELCSVCECFRRIDYNALRRDELGEVLETFNTMEDMCRRYRQRQPELRPGEESGDANDASLTVEVADDAPATVREAVVDGGELLLVDTITDTPEFVGNGEIALVATVADSESNDPESEVSDDV